jgi:hypothetical protein
MAVLILGGLVALVNGLVQSWIRRDIGAPAPDVAEKPAAKPG